MRSNPLRTMLSTLGVVIGVASLVAILSIGDSLERFSREQIEQTTDLQTIQVSPVTTDLVDGIRIRRDTVASLSPADAAALSELLSGEADVGVMQTGSGWLEVEGDTARHPVLISAVTASAQALGSAVMVEGRFLQDSDSMSVPVGAVASASLAARIDADTLSVVGRTVRLGAEEFRIVGILGGPTGSGTPRMLVPFSRRMLALEPIAGRDPTAIIRAGRIEDVESIRLRVEVWLGERYGSVDGLFRVSSSRARVEQAERAMLVFKLALGAIAGISLLVGGIGIMNILLASVSERTREIGVRKATGARHHDVLIQFLAESVLITGAGAFAGVLVGVLGSYGINAIIRSITEAPMKTTFSAWSILLAAAAALLVGLVFGTYPARKAARLSAVEAMRYE